LSAGRGRQLSAGRGRQPHRANAHRRRELVVPV